MGFLDFLRGIIPENLINFNIRKVEIVNKGCVIIGDQKIDNPETVDNIFDKLSEYKNKASLPCQIIHKDLDDSYMQYEEISIEQKESLKRLKVVLPLEEIECILMARRVKLAYDNGDIELAKRLHKQLFDIYPGKGNKVYNLIGGGYFDEMILPFIEIFRSQYDGSYVEEYRKFYYDIIKFFPLAFFVGNGTSEEQIVEGVGKRLKLNIPFVRLHAIGDNNIKKIENMMENFVIDGRYSINDNRFTSPAGLKAQILEIRVRQTQ